MPSSDHVDTNNKGRRAEYGVGLQGKRAAEGRRGVALELAGQSHSYLSPSRLLSNMGISNIRDYLPSSPSSLPPSSVTVSSRDVEGIFGEWQDTDLKDGLGRRPLLLLTSPSNGLQIFALPSSNIPSDPNVQEILPAPEEIISIPKLRYSQKVVRSSLGPEGAKAKGKEGHERIICAKLMDYGDLCSEHGTVALLLAAEEGPSGPSPPSQLSLLVLSLRSGEVVQKLQIGAGSAAALAISRKAIVIAISLPTPSLHFLSPATLEHSRDAVTDLPANIRTSLPTFTLSGRLLAYATSEPPHHPGPDRLGSIITARSLAPRSPTNTTKQSIPIQSSTSGQNVLNSAVGIGGGVARGVWAGIKMGAQAATRATNGRLATSAPAHGSLGIADSVTPGLGDEDSESRSLEDSSSILDELAGGSGPDPRPGGRGGEWIKIIDICPSSSRPATRTIAHFRLPNRTHPPPGARSPRLSDAHATPNSVSHLAFSPDGVSLFAAPADGRSFHLLDVHPPSPTASAIQVEEGEVRHMYELRRGNTAAAVSEVKWSQDGRWVGVATGRGTVHVFAINPSGGPPTAHVHVPAALTNPRILSTLSSIVTPSARLRMRTRGPLGSGDGHPFASPSINTSFSFGTQRAHPIKLETSCVDVAIYRSELQQVDAARLTVSYPAHPLIKPERQVTRRASALTEMMKARVGMGSSDFEISTDVKAAWALPSPCPDEVLPTLFSRPAYESRIKRNLAFAEIQTFSSNPHLLPASIYLSHQVDFYDARPIDEYSRLSIMDKEARTRRLHFRPEVEIRSSTPESGTKSFHEPLTTAIHSVIESTPSQELPHLPNGTGRNSNGFGYVHGLKSSIPIQQVKQGVGHLRREYAHRRRSSVRGRDRQGIALSFEEGAVFARGSDEEGEEEDDSPMSSASGSGVPITDDEEWGVRWEDEYSRAVEEEGGPDDLVLGLMDEQQEERKIWVEKQKMLAREYAK